MIKTLSSIGGITVVLGLLGWAMYSVLNRPVMYIPTRVQPYGDSLFFTVPRYRTNSGYSLVLRSDKGLTPFPNKEAHNSGKICNAVDIHLDSGGTLWVLDSGFIDTLKSPTKVNDPRVLALDADSGRINKVIELGNLTPGRVEYLAVDETKDATEFLYISDGPGRSIAVWNVKKDQGHRIELPESVMVGPGSSKVLYLALVGPKLYFTYFGSSELYYMDTWSLQNDGGRLVKVGRKDPRMIIIGCVGPRILFRFAGHMRVMAWDTKLPLTEDNLELVDRGRSKTSPVAAVPNLGKIWLLESDVEAFLKGEQASHVFRPTNRTVYGETTNRFEDSGSDNVQDNDVESARDESPHETNAYEPPHEDLYEKPSQETSSYGPREEQEEEQPPKGAVAYGPPQEEDEHEPMVKPNTPEQPTPSTWPPESDSNYVDAARPTLEPSEHDQHQKTNDETDVSPVPPTSEHDDIHTYKLKKTTHHDNEGAHGEQRNSEGVQDEQQVYGQSHDSGVPYQPVLRRGSQIEENDTEDNHEPYQTHNHDL